MRSQSFAINGQGHAIFQKIKLKRHWLSTRNASKDDLQRETQLEKPLNLTLNSVTLYIYKDT